MYFNLSLSDFEWMQKQINNARKEGYLTPPTLSPH